MSRSAGWGPITPARIDFDTQAVPFAPDFGDVYHTRAGALEQARHVFLGGNNLPGRWARRDRFVVLESGFGLGRNFLATWAAWRADPQRCQRLVFASVEKHPPRREDLRRALAQHVGDAAIAELAQQLLDAWPPLTPDIHPLDFEDGAVRLLLAFGDVATVLPDWQLQAEAIFLDGFAPARNAAMWEPRLLARLARLAAPDATLATWSASGALRRALAAAGFEVHKLPGFGGKREMTQARFAPRHSPAPPPGRRAATRRESIAVIGAGLAGAAAARALARQGHAVDVYEAQAQPATQGSGQPGGLFHGIVHVQDSPHARWLRAGALLMQRTMAASIAGQQLRGAIGGLLRGEQRLDLEAMRALLAATGLPPDYLKVSDDGAALGRSVWLYPGAGWAVPGDVVKTWLQHPNIRLHCGVRVDGIDQAAEQPQRWRALDAADRTLFEADLLVLANADDALRLLGHPRWPTGRQRGQTTWLPAAACRIDDGAPALPQPLAAGGYAMRLDDGRLLCGATSAAGDDDAQLRAADHAANLHTLERLTGWAAPEALRTQLQGKVGWRFVTDDRLPLIGPLPQPNPQGARLEQPRNVPRIDGLWLCAALGSRGLSQAALAGELLAAWIDGAPLPVPSSLVDAVDPARFIARARRMAQRPPRGGDSGPH